MVTTVRLRHGIVLALAGLVAGLGIVLGLYGTGGLSRVEQAAQGKLSALSPDAAVPGKDADKPAQRRRRRTSPPKTSPPKIKPQGRSRARRPRPPSRRASTSSASSRTAMRWWRPGPSEHGHRDAGRRQARRQGADRSERAIRHRPAGPAEGIERDHAAVEDGGWPGSPLAAERGRLGGAGGQEPPPRRPLDPRCADRGPLPARHPRDGPGRPGGQARRRGGGRTRPDAPPRTRRRGSSASMPSPAGACS